MINSTHNAKILASLEPVRQMLQSGQGYQLTDIRTDSPPRDIWCSDVTQRNWSRIATGFCKDREPADQRLFLKQYVDRAGQWNEDLWMYERSGVSIAHEVLGERIGIPALVSSDQTLVVNAFAYTDLLSMDELLRADSSAFERAYPVALECMLEVLEALQNQDFETRFHLPRKHRDYGDGAVALNFKGFELRNMGVTSGMQQAPTRDDFFLFDFGRAYMAPIQEAAAKLFVSIGLLNWGRPLSRFSKGPDFRLIEQAKQHLAPYLDRKAVEAELRLQRSFRWADIQGTGSLERNVKRLAITTLGGRYFHRLGNWCRSSLV